MDISLWPRVIWNNTLSLNFFGLVLNPIDWFFNFWNWLPNNIASIWTWIPMIWQYPATYIWRYLTGANAYESFGWIVVLSCTALGLSIWAAVVSGMFDSTEDQLSTIE